MTARNRRNFTEEFKNQIVSLFKVGKSKQEIIEEYKLNYSTLNRWIKQNKDSGSFKENDNRSPEEKELISLRKELKQLRMENDILKQAALIIGRK